MKNMYRIIFSIMIITGMAMMGCTPPPVLPVSATDGVGSDITVDWANYAAAGGTGPYTVLRATNPGMVGAAPVAGCVGTDATVCVDDDASANTAYFYMVTGTGDPAPPEGGFHGSLSGNHDPGGVWGTAYDAASALYNSDCPSTGMPSDPCSSDCPGGTGTYYMAIEEISGTDYFLMTQTLTDCDTGDYVIDAQLTGVITNTGAGYVVGMQSFTDETGSGNSGQVYITLTIENMGAIAAPSTSYSSSGTWDDAEFTDESP